MNKVFRDDLQGLASDNLRMLKGYFKGEEEDGEKVKAAIKILGFGVKMEHMNQMKNHTDKSLALRVLQFLPRDDPKTRMEYLKMTNPEIKTLLLKVPEKKKLKK